MSEHSKTWISNTILVSKAWLELGGKAPQVYLLFLSKRRMENIGTKRKKNWTCTNGKQLTFSYSEACKLGLSPDVFSRAIGALIKHGFLDVVTYGGGVEKRFTEYCLSRRWEKYGSEDFDAGRRDKHNRGFCQTKTGHGD